MSNLSKEELELLQWAKSHKPQVEKSKKSQQRNNVRQRLLIKKAVAANITVSEEEIDRYISQMK